MSRITESLYGRYGVALNEERKRKASNKVTNSRRKLARKPLKESRRRRPMKESACGDKKLEESAWDNIEKYLDESCGDKKRTINEEKYEDDIFQRIEQALYDAGFEVRRYSDGAAATYNLGWAVDDENGERVYLTCAGTWLDD